MMPFFIIQWRMVLGKYVGMWEMPISCLLHLCIHDAPILSEKENVGKNLIIPICVFIAPLYAIIVGLYYKCSKS